MMGIIGVLVSFVVAFALTLVLGFDREKSAEATTVTVNANGNNEILTSPLTGKTVALADVPDEVFASQALGKGIAIEPSIGEVRAPMAGVMTTVFPTGHAVGITTDSGIEVLIHIGMDTVELEGKGFELFVKQGDHVQAGDLLVKFDIEAIKADGKSVITPIVVTNTADFLDVLDFNQAEVVIGEDMLTIIK